MDNLGQTFIYGNKNGSPAFFDIKSKNTIQPAAVKKRKLADRDLDSNGVWIQGTKGGRVCYFNVHTKEERDTPPGKSPGVHTIDVASPLSSLSAVLPEATTCEKIEPISIDVVQPEDEKDMSITDQMIRDAFEDMGVGSSNDDILKNADGKIEGERRPSLPTLAPAGGVYYVPKYEMSKTELKKMRRREVANRFRLRKKEANERIKVLEVRVQELEKALAVSNARNESLEETVRLLERLVTSRAM